MPETNHKRDTPKSGEHASRSHVPLEPTGKSRSALLTCIYKGIRGETPLQ